MPAEWEAGVPGADLPDPATTSALPWQSFAIAQTGQLDKANGRTRDTIQIVRSCNKREAEVVKALAPRPWWKLWG